MFDVREGELGAVALAFAYIATVVASFLLAKPIRNGLFLGEFGAYNLVYVYVAVPLVLTAFVALYSRIAARFGQRRVIIATLVFFSLNVLAFWYAFTYHPFAALPALFYVWVNCYGIIAPVQAWSVANSLFDVRQARRLFGLIGGGASLGAIAGGLLAKTLVGPVGGAVNLMLVLAALIALAAALVNTVRRRIPRTSPATRRRVPLRRSVAHIARTRYLRLIAATVFLVAIVTQWTGFQFSLAAERRFEGNADLLTEFFGEFNFYMGCVALLIQLLLTGATLRRFGIALTLLILPLSLGLGSMLILLAPGLWSVLLTTGLDQSLRFSIDKASYELLFLPISANLRAQVKAAIDIVVSRAADAVGGILLGLATQGFLVFGGLGLELRGTAAVNLALIGVWTGVALALRREYVRAIRESIQQHRLGVEDAIRGSLDRDAARVLTEKLETGETEEILYALGLLEMQGPLGPHPALHALLDHPAAAVRRRSLVLLRAGGDTTAVSKAERLLRDPDLDTRTEALLYLTQHARIDPLARIRELGDFPDFSIRAGIVAFLAHDGPTQNLEAARVLLETMLKEGGAEGRQVRLEVARLMGSLPGGFSEELARLLNDRDPDVVREAIRAVGASERRTLAPLVVGWLRDPRCASEAAGTLVMLGDRIVGTLRDHLFDPAVPIEARRELPDVLRRIGTPAAQQALLEGLLQTDAALRLRIIAALNKLRRAGADLRLDAQSIEMVLAAEILGHYRSYQILGRLEAGATRDDAILAALRQSLDQEVERIFRLLALLRPDQDLHSAYVGLRSDNATVRANALEFLDNVLEPQLRSLLVPLLDHQVTTAERIRIANRLVGTGVETEEEAVRTMLGTGDEWLRMCAINTIATLRLAGLEPELAALASDPDPLVRQAARAAQARLRGEATAPPEQPHEPMAWEPADTIGVG